MAASQNGFFSYTLSIHKKINIMQIMTKSITIFIYLFFYHREIVKLDHFMTLSLSYSNTVLWCSNCKTHRFAAAPWIRPFPKKASPVSFAWSPNLKDFMLFCQLGGLRNCWLCPKGDELQLAGAKLSQEAGKPIKLRYKQPTNRKKANNRPYTD
jgi:hypothetical protein